MFDLLKKYRFRLSPKSNQIFTWMSIGENQYPLLVVDNFYADPDWVAKMAHTQNFQNPHGMHINSLANVVGNKKRINRFIFEHFAKKLGVTKLRSLHGDTDVHKFYRSMPSATDLPIRREDPHSDGVFFIAGVLYLTPNELCKGGTGFYRNRATGAEEKPPSPMWLSENRVTDSVVNALGKYNIYRAYRASSFNSYEEFRKSIPSKTHGNRYQLSTSNEHWELRQVVPMKYNRLILYPAFAIHKAIYQEDDFDGPEENRRLTENFFFKYPVKHYAD